jgi:hypothetical protein
LEVTLKVPAEPDAEATVMPAGETDKAGLTPDCVTTTLTEDTPAAEKVTLAVLVPVEVLAVEAVTARVPLPVPDAAERLSQDASSVTVQLVLEVTLKLPVEPAIEFTVSFEGDTDKDRPDPSQGRLLYLTSSFIIKKVPRP